MTKENSLLHRVVVSIRNSVYKARYYHLDVLKQRLISRPSGTSAQFHGKVYFDTKVTHQYICIFVYFEPNGKISNSNQRILKALNRNGVTTCVVANHKLSESQIEFFETHSITYFQRKNVGFDFGAYKDAINWLETNNVEFSRLILLNDSVFYIENGLDDFVKGLLAQTEPTKDMDAIAAYENWGEGYHLQSFALSVTSDVAKGKNFENFWRTYAPISNRIYAIEKGEKKLSCALLKDSHTSAVLYNVGTLNQLVENDDNFTFQNKYVPIPFRPAFENIQTKNKAKFKQGVVDAISQTSPIHAGAYYFPKYLKSPIFKKDLVFRQRFHFWEIQDWGSEIMTEEELQEFMQILRKKADWRSLTRSELRKYNIGVK